MFAIWLLLDIPTMGCPVQANLNDTCCCLLCVAHIVSFDKDIPFMGISIRKQITQLFSVYLPPSTLYQAIRLFETVFKTTPTLSRPTFEREQKGCRQKGCWSKTYQLVSTSAERCQHTGWTLYVCIYTYIYIYIYIHTHTHTSTYMYIHTSIHIYVYICIYI